MKAVKWAIFFLIEPVCFSIDFPFENGSQSPTVHEFNKVAWFNGILNKIPFSQSEAAAKKEEQGVLWKYDLFQKIKKIAAVVGPAGVNAILSWLLSSLAAKKGYGRIRPLSIFAGLEILSYFAVSRPCLKKIHESEIEAQYIPMIKYASVMDQVKKAVDFDKCLKQRLFFNKNDQDESDNRRLYCICFAAYKGYPELFKRALRNEVLPMIRDDCESKEQLEYRNNYLRQIIDLLMGGEYYQSWRELICSLQSTECFQAAILSSLQQAIFWGREDIVRAFFQAVSILPKDQKESFSANLMNAVFNVSEDISDESDDVLDQPHEQCWKSLCLFVENCQQNNIAVETNVFDRVLCAMSVDEKFNDREKFAYISEQSSLNLKNYSVCLCITNFAHYKDGWYISKILEKLNQQGADLTQHIPEKFRRQFIIGIFKAFKKDLSSEQLDQRIQEMDQSYITWISKIFVVPLGEELKQLSGQEKKAKKAWWQRERRIQKIQQKKALLWQNSDASNLLKNFYGLIENVKQNDNESLEEDLNSAYKNIFDLMIMNPNFAGLGEIEKKIWRQLNDADLAQRLVIVCSLNISDEDIEWICENSPETLWNSTVDRIKDQDVPCIEYVTFALLERQNVDHKVVQFFMNLMQKNSHLFLFVYQQLGKLVGRDAQITWQDCENMLRILLQNSSPFNAAQNFLYQVIIAKNTNQQFLQDLEGTQENRIKWVLERLMQQCPTLMDKQPKVERDGSGQLFVNNEGGHPGVIS